ncbi:nucleotidyltransferase domain-containing protein [Candidatus Woesearchaeota archaeon]|nr:nucleotidyltransferase domain-containing protein [Candidatus Woesearchaeota archaeon]
MAKAKKGSKKKQDDKETKEEAKEDAKEMPQEQNIPPEVKKKLEKIKSELDNFSKQLLEKFENYIMGIGLLPPRKDDKEKNEINVAVLVDDSDRKKMTPEELKSKLSAIIEDIAQKIDKNIKPETIVLSELWQSLMDGKDDLSKMFAISAPVFDRGMLAALKITDIHKEMVLKKFEKYIVSYVLAGSLVQGRATPDSDIDVFIVVDDTDVKKMTRFELKDKLRAIIIGMGIEAGGMTGIKNKLNIQVYILTDFWENMKEAHPVIFTFLRDGVPLYDRGIFMPWKQLLKMGRIKPSPEAIEQFMEGGEKTLERVKHKLNDIGTEDFFWATLTPSQAALMQYGVPPPTPKETPDLMKEIFVTKEKMLEQKYVDILRKIITLRKEFEYGKKKEISGAEIDKLNSEADDYLKRIKRLFTQIEKVKQEETVVKIYDTACTVVRDVLKLDGIVNVKDTDLPREFTSEIINKGKIPQRFLRDFEELLKAKQAYDDGKLTKTEVEQTRKQSHELVSALVEYMQRRRGAELERTKIKVKHGSKFGEIILLGDTAFIVRDIDAEEKEITKADILPSGGIGPAQKSSLEEMEEHIAKIQVPEKAFIKEPIFEDLKRIFGNNVEILVKY